MTTLNNVTNQEIFDKYFDYVRMCEAGTLESTAEVVTEIESLMESEEIIYEELKNLLIRFDFSGFEAMCFASERMLEAYQMLADVRSKYYIGK